MSHEQRVAWMLCFALLAFYGLVAYLHRRCAEAFRFPPASGRVFAVLAVLTSLSALLPRFFSEHLGQLAAPLGMFATCLVLSVLVSSVLLLPFEVARGGARLAAWAARRFARAAGREQPERWQDTPKSAARRAFVQQAAVGGALSLGVGSTLYGTLLGRHDYQLEHVPIKLSKLPRALDGFSIVQLSDLHVGSFVGDYEFSRGLELVRRAKPDLIVLTGDLIDHDLRYLPELGRFARALASRARYGLYAVPGNHDHYVGAQHVEATLRAAGAELLINRHVRIGDGSAGFVLAGLDDVMGGPLAGRGPDLARAFAGARDEDARVLLSHNPGYFPTSHPFADLTLSGHTHGGQITLFINPAKLVLGHGLVRGHYLRDASQLYVNRGFGTAGPPTRVGSPPEVTRLVLTT
jgi:predicted MPP superfamily phosphohydrolase